jgi:hypothetical protein
MTCTRADIHVGCLTDGQQIENHASFVPIFMLVASRMDSRLRIMIPSISHATPSWKCSRKIKKPSSVNVKRVRKRAAAG